MDEYPAGHRGALMDRRPVLCAECHASNAIGAPGAGDVPSLSRAMHEKHAGKVPNTIAGCYNCHPGPQTQCLRDVMSQLPAPDTQTCITCHGNMEAVSQNPTPWLNEPRCDTCHNNGKYNQNQALYRMSKDHGGVYCEACHDSTHAIAPSTQPNKDGLKFIPAARPQRADRYVHRLSRFYCRREPGRTALLRREPDRSPSILTDRAHLIAARR